MLVSKKYLMCILVLYFIIIITGKEYVCVLKLHSAVKESDLARVCTCNTCTCTYMYTCTCTCIDVHVLVNVLVHTCTCTCILVLMYL